LGWRAGAPGGSADFAESAATRRQVSGRSDSGAAVCAFAWCDARVHATKTQAASGRIRMGTLTPNGSGDSLQRGFTCYATSVPTALRRTPSGASGACDGDLPAVMRETTARSGARIALATSSELFLGAGGHRSIRVRTHDRFIDLDPEA